MASIQNQIKARIQQIGSPKIKLTNNVTINQMGQQVQPVSQGMIKTQPQKPMSRDGNNQNQSPDDQGANNRGVLQRIQMKNLAFIPAKGQSPISLNHNFQNQVSQGHINESSPSDGTNASQIQKISPPRIIGIGNKVIIPANQIKLVKKDGASPSPEGRQNINIKQLSPTSVNFVMQHNNLQNKNINIQQNLNGGSAVDPTPLNINNQNKSSKNLLSIITQQQQQQQFSLQQNPSSQQLHENKYSNQGLNFQPSQLSDDETNINSDNEDDRPAHSQRNSAALNQMKGDQANFNRPKINPNQQSSISTATLTDQTLASQRTSRGTQQNSQQNKTHQIQTGFQVQEQTKLKISQNKIRQSPSPTPNQVFKNMNQPPVVTNVQNQMKQQQYSNHLQQNHNSQLFNQQQMSQNNSNQNFTHAPSHQQHHHHPQNQAIQNFNQGAHFNNFQMPTQNLQQPQTSQQQQQLASDFIKGMINQSKNNASQNQTTTQKKILGTGLQSVLKKGLLSGQTVNNNLQNQLQQNIQSQQTTTNFHKDMKRHGIAKDMNDVSKFTPILSESSPPRVEENKLIITTSQTNKVIPQKLSIAKISHIRNYSPPPNFDQSGLTPLNDIKDVSKITTKPTDSSPTNISTQHEEQNQTNQGTNEQGAVFQFPFQRRARSLSLPKQEIIQNKMNQKNQGVSPPNGVTAQDGDKTSQSPNRGLDQDKAQRNKPVVAKINFVIQKGGVIEKVNEEAIFERQKEVDEWLMGSGESDATAASNTGNNIKPSNQIFPQTIQAQINNTNIIVSSSKHTHAAKKSITNFDKPVQPDMQNEGDDDSVGQEEEEDWMFRTFDKVKAKKEAGVIPPSQNKNQNIPNTNQNVPNTNQNVALQSRRLESNRDLNLHEQPFEDPFEMAPEMKSKVNLIDQNDFDPFMSDLKLPTNKGVKVNSKNENIGGADLKQIGSFIDEIDDYIESNFY